MPDPVPAPAPAPEPAAWHASAEPELLGHLQSHGWDKLPANEAALAVAKSHRDAQKFIGAPPDKIVRLPTDANDAAGWKNVWQKLGAPVDGKYDFTTVKRADGNAIEKPLADALHATAVRLNLPKDTAVGVVTDIVKVLDQQAATKKAEDDAMIAAGRQELDKNWGANKTANLLVAQNAFKALGMPQQALDTLEKMDGVGYAKVMELMRTIGTKIGEDKFISGGGPVPGVMTLEQAGTRKAELMGDKGFVDRWLNSDTLAIKELAALDYIIAGVTL